MQALYTVGVFVNAAVSVWALCCRMTGLFVTDDCNQTQTLGNHVQYQDRGLGSSHVAATRFTGSCIRTVAWPRLACRAPRLRAPVPYDSVEPAPSPACASLAPRQDRS